MLRAVIDTNLLISYALTKGETLSRLIDHWEKRTFVYVVSPPIIAELREVLARPKLRSKMAVAPDLLLEAIESDTEQTPGVLTLPSVCRDPKDEMFLACAVEGEADYLVSGDSDLLELGEYQKFKIIRPAEFVSLLDALEETADAET